MTLSNRQRAMTRILLELDRPITMSSIASELNINSRMVRYDLQTIRRWLEVRGVRLVKKPNWGVLADAPIAKRADLLDELHELAGYHLVLSSAERLQVVVWYLLTSEEPLLTKQLARRLGVSRTTVLSDMNRAEEWLKERKLSLIRRQHFGFKALGEEWERREAMVELLMDNAGQTHLLDLARNHKQIHQLQATRVTSLLSPMWEFLANLELSYSRGLLDSAVDMLHLQLTDSSYVSVLLYMAIQIHNMQQGKFVDVRRVALGILSRNTVFHSVETIAERIEQRFGIAVPSSETACLTIHLLGSEVRPVRDDVTGDIDANRSDPAIREMVNSLVAEASLFLHPYLKVDQQLARSLACHLRPTLNRLIFDLPIRNPLLEDVKQQYQYVFQVATRASARLEEKIGREIPEDEIGYIAMHFQAALERICPFAGVKREVLVICAEGIATAWLLVARIRAEFPEVQVVEVTSVLQASGKPAILGSVDAIISTVPVRVEGIPVISVSPLLTKRDKASIRSILRLGDYDREASDSGSRAMGPSLDSLITSETVVTRFITNDWGDVVDKAGRLLLNVGAIRAKYIEAMKDMIVKYGPYMIIGRGIVLLHARPEDGVNRLCMSLVTLGRPVRFGKRDSDRVDVAIAFGAVDDHSHLAALAQLASLVEDETKVLAIRNASSKERVLEVVACVASGGA